MFIVWPSCKIPLLTIDLNERPLIAPLFTHQNTFKARLGPDWFLGNG